MKLSARMITSIAVATLMQPAFLLGAEHSIQSSGGADETTATLASNTRAGVANSQLDASQTATPSLPSRRPSWDTPRAELFLGYSYLRAVPTLSPGNRMEWLNGGSTSIAFNLNRYLGLVGDFGGFKATELQLTGAGANPARVADATGTAFTYLAGPRVSYRKYDHLTPFAQALFGGIHASEVTLSGCTGVLCTPLPVENAFAMTAGGGVDLKVRHHLSIRMIQAEYLMTRFADLSTGDRKTQNDIRLSSGLVFGFGEISPPLPVTYTCAASPASVYPGDPISVTGTALNLNPKKTATYTWKTDGGTTTGTTGVASIDTKSAAPGNYTAVGQVSEGGKPGQSARCTAAYAVLAFQPPTVSCSANPSTVLPGDSAIINTQAASPQNRPLTYSYSTSQGSISGTTSNPTLRTAGVSPATITVTCNVVDDRGQTASSTAAVTVQVPPAPSAPTPQPLCSISFARDPKRPTRVDNEAKACLDDIALNLQRSSDTRVALVGHNDTNERYEAAQRVVNTKEYLVRDKGIDASRVVIYTNSNNSKTVDTTLVPAGAQLDQRDLTPVDESVKPVARKTASREHNRR
jgi:hypothetical protein